MAAKFEERFGEGMTELDALEALHPGELQRILVTEIERYYDDGLDDEIANEVEKPEDEIRQTMPASIVVMPRTSPR